MGKEECGPRREVPKLSWLLALSLPVGRSMAAGKGWYGLSQHTAERPTGGVSVPEVQLAQRPTFLPLFRSGLPVTLGLNSSQVKGRDNTYLTLGRVSCFPPEATLSM